MLTLVHVRSFTDALTRYARLFSAVVRRIRTRVARFVGTRTEQRRNRGTDDGVRRMPTRCALTLCARIEVG